MWLSLTPYDYNIEIDIRRSYIHFLMITSGPNSKSNIHTVFVQINKYIFT